MPSRNTCKYLSMTQAGLAAYMHDRADELFDAIITAAAMVARADGWIDPVERSQLLGFLNRNGFLAVFTREEVLDGRSILMLGSASIMRHARIRAAGCFGGSPMQPSLMPCR